MSILSLLVCLMFIAIPVDPVGSPAIDAGPGGVLWDGRLYEFGRLVKSADPFDGDAWLRITDASTHAEIATYLYDGGNDETFIYFAILADDVFTLVTETRGIPGSGGSSLRKTEILTFTRDGSYLDRAGVPGLMTGYNNHGHLLVLSKDDAHAADYVFDASLAETTLPEELAAEGSFAYQYRGFATIDGADVDQILIEEPGIYELTVSDGEYVYRACVTVDPLIAGVIAGGTYDEGVTITAKGVLSIDGAPYASGDVFAMPGNHELAIAGENGYRKTLSFVIRPYVANIADDFQTTDAIRIFSNASALMIDEAPYAAGDPYRIPGRHVLTVYAANGYLRTIAFAILPSAAGVEDGGVYEGGVTIALNGTAVLGGIGVAGTLAVTDPGTYELVLYFDGEPYRTVSFTIVAAPVPMSWWEAFPFVEVLSGACAVVGLFLIFRKK
ncbi:MAG TPA: hypothetical protein DCR44_03430 [Acholeplasmatales bacterium]|nr:MAG: hypothetical protein A2Y16_01065 [Tenericutes bacterium GWF2_57_13]HAQ56441.1 hypothetical protein [Acholeplasmatales bacterium]